MSGDVTRLTHPFHGNRMLDLLPKTDMDKLKPHLEEVELALRQDLFLPHEPIRHVYFVKQGVASLVKHTEEGQIIEIATVGAEGMVGVALFLGSDTIDQHAMIQIAGSGYRMKAHDFVHLVGEVPSLSTMMSRYTLALMNQMAQTATCNRVHDVDARCARWLLMTHDRVGSDTFPLTQEFLAMMLGVHRPTVSLAASMLQKAGLIRYVRGVITITDRKGLEAASCECYDAISAEYERLLAPQKQQVGGE